MLALRKYSCLAANTVFRLQVLKEVAKALIRHFVVLLLSQGHSCSCPCVVQVIPHCCCVSVNTTIHCVMSPLRTVSSVVLVSASAHTVSVEILAMHYCSSPVGAFLSLFFFFWLAVNPTLLRLLNSHHHHSFVCSLDLLDAELSL